ncbi:dendrin [Pelodytes ibericus]
MDSCKWIDLDDAWLYRSAPRKHPDSRFGYSTMPGRRSVDIARRPADERGIYGTIPGRFVDRRSMGDQSPCVVRSISRLTQNSVLQDSTNWSPSGPPRARSPKMLRMEQKINANERCEGRYDGSIYDRVKNLGELERKRRKLLREEEAELANLSSSDKHRRKGKSMEVDTIYEQPNYTQYHKMKEAHYDDWGPLLQPPKALQNQPVSQTPKVLLNQTQPQSLKTKSAEKSLPVQEKKRWWFKIHKQSKPVPNVMVPSNSQEGFSKRHVEEGALSNYTVYTQQGSKENQPKTRKRKGPPPYVPPPSYNSPHHTFNVSKNKPMDTEKMALREILPLTTGDILKPNGDKLPGYSVEHFRNLNLPSHSSLSREHGQNKNSSEQIYENTVRDRRLPRPYSTWGGERSHWHLNQPSSNDREFLDHIYEIVEGGSSPINSNAPGERTYGTISVPHQRERSMDYTLPRRGNSDLKTSKKNKIIENGDPHKKPPSDVHRPPIQSHGVKLPYELGFSYTSGKLQYKDKMLGAEYRISDDPGDEEPASERRRQLRVLSSKERRSQGHSAFIPSKEGHAWYSQTLPLKKEIHGHIKSDLPDSKPAVQPIKKRISSQDLAFPNWREPGKINTLPARSNHQNRWRQYDELTRGAKYNLSEPSKNYDSGSLRKSLLKGTTSENIQSPSSKEGEGMFVIDATCVVVKAEYIFPPRMEQVQFLTHPEIPQGLLSDQEHFVSNVRNRKASPYFSQPKSTWSNEVYYSPHSPKTKHHSRLSSERLIPNLTERAVRILGLSVVELEALNEDKNNQITKQPELQSLLEEETLDECNNIGEYKHNECNNIGEYKHNECNNIGEYKHNECNNIGEYKHNECNNIGEYKHNECNNIGEYKHNECNNIGEYKHSECRGKPFNIIVEVENTPASSSLPGCDDGEQTFNQTVVDSTCAKANHELVSEQNMAARSMETNSEGTDHNSVIEPISEKNNTGNKTVSVQFTIQNDFAASEMEVETHLAEEMESPCQDPTLGTKDMNFQEPFNMQLLKDTNSVSTECIVKNKSKAELHAIKSPEQKTYRVNNVAGETIKSNAKSKVSFDNDNGQESNGRMQSRNYTEHSVKAPHTNVVPDNPCVKQVDQKVSAELNPPVDQTHSTRNNVKPFPKRQNYFAKDLREAVSRIRRHTAPDSDTDEDLDRPLFDSGSVRSGESMGEESVTSCSSDTSDSEVTVILCEADREDLITQTEGTDCPQDLDNENVTGCDGVEDFTMEDLKTDEIDSKFNHVHIPENQQVSTCLDLDSCIEEILQDLSKTEEEFFPLSTD